MIKLELLRLINEELKRELQVREMDEKFRAEFAKLAELTKRINEVLQDLPK